MAYEIIFVCNSKNNKNIREGELKILRKHENELYFEFGESEINLKKRFYDNLEDLNKDYEKVLKLKNQADKEDAAAKYSKLKKECEEEQEEQDESKYKRKTIL